MKKGDGKEKFNGEEIIYKLSTNKKFIADLISARKNTGIPIKGFSNDEEQECWLFKNVDRGIRVLGEAELLCKKYGVSITYDGYFFDYICFGKNHDRHRTEYIKVVQPTHVENKKYYIHPDEEYLIERGEPYVKVLVLSTGSKTDVQRAVKDYWWEIEEKFREQGVSIGNRIRKAVFKERNLLIKGLYKKSINELKKMAGENYGYKDGLIGYILEKRGYGKVSDGYIRKIGSSNPPFKL